LVVVVVQEVLVQILFFHLSLQQVVVVVATL
jgi:hypothetical protein